MLKIQQYRPQILQHYIESFKVYHFGKDEEVVLYPKGIFEVVFQSNDGFQHNTSYSNRWENRPKDFVGGLHNKSYTVKPEGHNNYCVVAEFKPCTARNFIPHKLHHFQNNLVEVRDVWGPSADRLTQALAKEESGQQKARCLETFLFDRLDQQKRSVIDRAIQKILIAKGFVVVNELARQVGLSVAQFRKRFREEIGIAPSQYCKIVRVNFSLELLRHNDRTKLTELTYQLGYFDQAHFIKDFKSVTGASPKHFRKQEV